MNKSATDENNVSIDVVERTCIHAVAGYSCNGSVVKVKQLCMLFAYTPIQKYSHVWHT